MKKILWAAIVAVVALAACSEKEDGGSDPTVIAGTITQIDYTCVDSDTESCIYYITYDSDGRISQVETNVYPSYEFGNYASPTVKYGKVKKVYAYASDKISIQRYEAVGDSVDSVGDYVKDDDVTTYGLNSDGYITYLGDYHSNPSAYSQEYTYGADGYLSKMVQWGYETHSYEWSNGSIVNASYDDDSDSDREFTMTYSNVENNANIDITYLTSEMFWLECWLAGSPMGKRSKYLIDSSSRDNSYGKVVTKSEYVVDNGRVSEVKFYYNEIEDGEAGEPELDEIYKFTYAE